MVYTHAHCSSSGVADDCHDLWSIRARRRLALLEALSAKLTDLGVPHVVKHHTPNLAPSDPAERTIPLHRAGERKGFLGVAAQGGGPLSNPADIRHHVAHALATELADRGVSLQRVDAAFRGAAEGTKRFSRVPSAYPARSVTTVYAGHGLAYC